MLSKHVFSDKFQLLNKTYTMYTSNGFHFISLLFDIMNTLFGKNKQFKWKCMF